MLAMFVAFAAAGTLTYFTNGSNVGLLDEGTLGHLTAYTATAIAALLFVGAVGKSAQLPLYLWLPDAMAGPTPVSALIHAATMVTAGVYLMTRVSPLLAHGYTWLPAAIAVIGALTAFFAATVAIAQNDIKRVLAYSTVSQLGYMFLAIGSGAYVAAVFHMITHAFFKGLLFLGAGSVIHGMHDEQDMRRMGGLRKYMPVTAVTFIVGWLAIAGIFPFSGFWSKDEILVSAWAHGGSPLWKVLWFVGFVTALLTAYYMSRQVFLVFFGEERWREEADDGGEAERRSGSTPRPTTPQVARRAHAPSRTSRRGRCCCRSSFSGVLSTIGGALNLPFSESTKFLQRWLRAGRGGVGAERSTSRVSCSSRSAAVHVPAVRGCDRPRARASTSSTSSSRSSPRCSPTRITTTRRVTAFVGGPGEEAFEKTSPSSTRDVIDGAVTGVGSLVREDGVASSGSRRRATCATTRSASRSVRSS